MSWPRRAAAAAEDDAAALTARALKLLARREHSALELKRKLLRNGDDATVRGVVEGLAQRGLLSDERFAESFVRSRIERGQGPAKIRAELLARGVTDALIEGALSQAAEFWFERARAALAKRFGAAPPADAEERGRRTRFLSMRGYQADIAYRVASGSEAGQPV